MGKRRANETKEERRERKRLKKESSSSTKEKKKKKKKEHHNGDKNIEVNSKTKSGSKDDSGSSSINRKKENDRRRSLDPVVDDESKTKKCILWKKKLHFVVSLLPSTLGRSHKCIEDSLRLLLLKHSDSVGGILLAFDNVTIICDKNGTNGGGKNNNGVGRGWILNELPYIHYNVSCDALVFKPTVGCTVRKRFFVLLTSH